MLIKLEGKGIEKISIEMGLLKKWRKKRELRYIPAELVYEPLYRTLKSFNKDIAGRIKISKREYHKKEKAPIVKKLIKNKPRVTKDIVYRSHDGGFYDATYKIVLFGDSSVNKTQLSKKFLTNLFKSDTIMTIGVDFEVKSLEIDDHWIKLQIWDFGGEERFRFLLSTYVRGANGALFLYDITNYSTLAHIDDWLKVIRKEMRQKDIFPILVVGLVSGFEGERQISSEEAIKIAKSRGADGFIECSPRTGENVEETFEALTRLMLANSGFGETI
ncbi:MAG: Rab family GTPase [Promethearchaeota archaeon]